MAEAAFTFLPLGSVRPAGWLAEQLRVQAEGLSGRIEELWEDLGPRSGWRGGDGESWERGPYYLDGLVPLGHVLADERLRARAAPWIEWTLKSQRADGSFGPPAPVSRWGPNWWYQVPMLKALAQHEEATADARVVPFLERFFAYQARELGRRPLREWGRARAGEIDVVLGWLHDRTGAPDVLEHRRRVRAQALDWTAELASFRWAKLPEPFAFRHETHVVNVAMALKYPAVWSLWSGRDEDRRAMPAGLEALDAHHGQVNGTIAGDEHLAGRAPTRGTELCAVVETMYSLQHLLRVTGDARYGDRLELVAFNALPATFDAGMHVHQYDQQVNQVMCTDAERPWVNNGPRANVFGLEPNFGCCAANFHQGWPKLAANAWLAAPGGGAAAAVLVPSSARFRAADGTAVVVAMETDYPFGEEVVLRARSAGPVRFPLHVRIPAWCREPTLDGAPVRPGAFHVVAAQLDGERSWRLRLPQHVRGARGPGDALSLHVGPLLLAHPVPFAWTPLGDRPWPFGDREAWPVGPFGHALETDEGDLQALSVHRGPPGAPPFDETRPAVRVRVPARHLPSWGLDGHQLAPLPASPVRAEGVRRDLELVPYGATILRVAAFPTCGPAARRSPV